MKPEINNGEFIAIKKIEDLSFIPLCKVYNIVTTDGMRTIKHIGLSQYLEYYTSYRQINLQNTAFRNFQKI